MRMNLVGLLYHARQNFANAHIQTTILHYIVIQKKNFRQNKFASIKGHKELRPAGRRDYASKP